MALVTRPLTVDDTQQSRRLGAEAFGVPPVPHSPPDQPSAWPAPGRSDWGTFDGENLLARAIRRSYTSWFAGVAVATNGVAGVTVAAEHRGRGLLEPVMAAVLSEGRAAGEVISTLFPSAPGIYRRLGYELISSYDVVEVPTASAAAVRPGSGVHTRRAEARDVPAIAAVYERWAQAQNGPLRRSGASYPDPAAEFFTDYTGVSLACDDDGGVLGYASWTRGPGESDPIEVDDLLAMTPDAYRALWRVLGSFVSITPTLRLGTSGRDVARLFLPAMDWRVVASNPYMLRVDDVIGAMNVRPPHLAAELAFAVAGDELSVMNGTYLLTPDGEGSVCARIAPGAHTPVFSARGLALAWSGAQSCANIRMAGELTGGDRSFDEAFDGAFGGRQLHIRDAF